jgi:hypothetical protein
MQELQRQYDNDMWERGYKERSLNQRNIPDQKSAASYAPDGSWTYGEVDPITGKKIFYDENGAFYNS